MSFSVRQMTAVLMAVLGVAVPVLAQSTTAQVTKIPRGTISGRITVKDKGAAGVNVGIRKTNRNLPTYGEPFSKTVTDHDGNYRITNLPAASYEVTPSMPAFVFTGPNNARSKSVIIGEDESVDGINFSLVRGGVITGRVTDEDGRPVIQQPVQVYRSDTLDQPSQSPRQVFAAISVNTDDRGIYRVFGLYAGSYRVAAGRSEEAYMNPSLPGQSSYKQVFHPDVSDQAKATLIEVKEGSETANVDIALGRAIQTFSASGRVLDDKGAPYPNLRFGFQRSTGQRVEFTNNMSVSNAQGDFVAEGLIPGKYGLYLFPNQSSDLRAETLSFEVVDQDVTGLTVKLLKGASLTGVVTLETEDKSAFENLIKMQLRAFVTQGSGLAQSATSTISPDGSFRLAGLPPGNVNIMLGSVMGPTISGYNISRVERDGVVLPRAIEVKDGESLSGIRVVVAFGNATLRGVVKFENGTLPEGANAFVRLTKPGETGSYLRPAQVDTRGHFMIEGIPPGVYELQAQVVGAIAAPPKVVKREVNVLEGMVTEVVITIDLTPTLPRP